MINKTEVRDSTVGGDFAGRDILNINQKEKTFSILGTVLSIMLNKINNEEMIENRYEEIYKVKEKIDFNQLKVFNETIYEWIDYMSYIDAFFKKDIFKNAIKYKMFNSNIKKKYKNELINLNIDNSQIEIIRMHSDKIFQNISKNLLFQIKDDKELIGIESDFIESALDIILVKAFIDCNILENPNQGI